MAEMHCLHWIPGKSDSFITLKIWYTISHQFNIHSFQAGIKCAILTSGGHVAAFETVQFLGNATDSGKCKLVSLLEQVREKSSGECKNVLVVLGNGHGTREARALLDEAASDAGIETSVQLVNEAGASVWSVTESAQQEFPDQAPSAIACASIGRR
jgi:transcriptional accessory protein Tex/SPT6